VPELCAYSSSVRGSKMLDKAPEVSMPKTGKLQPIIQGMYASFFPFFSFLLFSSLTIRLIISDPFTGSYSWGS